MSDAHPNHRGHEVLFVQDVHDEGEPEVEFDPGIAGRLPRKSVASGALIRNSAGLMLFVSPIYKPVLEIPGGLAEDNESPLAACHREIREELGIDVSVDRLLLVDWVPTHGVWRDSLQFIFDGGVLTSEQIEAIKPAEGELSQFEFLELNEAKPRLQPSMARRVETAHRALIDGVMFYGEFGRIGLS